MAITFTMEVPGVTDEQLDRLGAAIADAAGGPPAGLICHMEVPGEGATTVTDVWESQEDFDRFSEEVLLPAMRAVGIDSGGLQPQTRQVRTLIGSAVARPVIPAPGVPAQGSPAAPERREQEA